MKISRKAWLARENNPTVLAICKSAGGVPASQITWYSDDEVIQNQIQAISDLNQSTLKLNLTREQDGAFITCRAYHQLYEDNFSEEVLELRSGFYFTITSRLMKFQRFCCISHSSHRYHIIWSVLSLYGPG